MTILCISDWTGIISTLIASGAGLLGVYISIQQWKGEKNIQRENEKKELLTKLVGKVLGDLDYVIRQYEIFNKKNEVKTEIEWHRLQTRTEPIVKDAQTTLSEAELKLEDDNLIELLLKIQQVFISIVNKSAKNDNDISTELKDYTLLKKNFISMARTHLKFEQKKLNN